MKIVDVLPREFVDYMGGCEDQNLIKRFSGRTLLRIAEIESPIQRQYLISNIMEKMEVSQM